MQGLYMNFFKSVQLLSFVVISFLSVDVYGSGKYQSLAQMNNVGMPHAVDHVVNEAEGLNARFYSAGSKFQHTVVTQHSDRTRTEVINKKHTYPVIKHNGKVYKVGPEITGGEQETRIGREVCCCGCEPLRPEADLTPCCCLCVLIQKYCGYVRTIEYPESPFL